MALAGALVNRLFGGSNYAYVTARVRAKKPKLVPREDYTKFLAMDVNGIALALQEGEYKREVLQLADRMSGALLVETATRLNLAHTFTALLEMGRGELKSLLLLYLQRFDVYNIKTVLRGRFAGASEEEVTRNLIPAGALTVDDLEGLTRLGSLSEVVEALKATPYGRVFESVPQNVQRLTEIENALDRHYYSALLAAVDGAKTEATKAFANYVKEEVDAVNIKTVLRLRVAGIEDGGDLILPGGREISADRARRLLRAQPGEFVSDLEGTRIAPALDGIRQTLESGDLNPAVTALDHMLVELARPFSQRYPLSILPVIDYVLRKSREVDNLRIIAYGKATGLKEEVLETLVVT